MSNVERNWRGKYPPIAILEDARRALSSSMNSNRRHGNLSYETWNDLTDAYLAIFGIESTIRERRGLPEIVTIPRWIMEVLRQQTIEAGKANK